MNNIDLFLLSLPVRAIDRPPLSIPVLAGNIIDAGFRVIQSDQNIIFQNLLLTEESLDYLYGTLLPLLIRTNSNNSEFFNKYKEFYNLLANIREKYNFKKIESIKEKMQNRNIDVITSEENFRALNDLFAISGHLNFYFINVIYYGKFLNNQGIRENIYKEVQKLIESIISKNPLIIGVSVIERQRAFSIWFAKMLRKRYRGHIVFGGSDPSLNREKYLKENDFIDFVIYGEGEKALIDLLHNIKQDSKDYSSIKNLIYREKDKIVVNKYFKHSKYEYIIPSYKGLPLNKYIFPVLQIITSKGCSWSKCKFCMHWQSYGKKFIQREAKEVAIEMQHYFNNYNIRFFVIIDEAISADYGIKLSSEIKKRKLNIRWIQMSRLDSDFQYEVFKTLFEAGCRIIEWGLETGSQRVADDMSKGINIEDVQRIIQESAHNGIINKMLMFYNYPTEKIDDLIKSINIIKKNTFNRLVKPMLTLRHAFVLKMGSPLAKIAFNNEGKNSKYFFKVWKPGSIYNVNAKHINRNRKENEAKKMLINNYLSEMKEYLEYNKIFLTNNNNITMDLICIDLIEQGKNLPLDIFLPKAKNLKSFYSFKY